MGGGGGEGGGGLNGGSLTASIPTPGGAPSWASGRMPNVVWYLECRLGMCGQ